jgi:hypothetical protein
MLGRAAMFRRCPDRRGGNGLKLDFPLFYTNNGIFDGVSISVAAHTKSEAESIECRFEMSRRIDQKRDVVHLLFPAEIAKKQQR